MHDPLSERMSGAETRAAGGLALVFAFRMLGMFMVYRCWPPMAWTSRARLQR
ncbi:MAG: major facilitator transporter [Pseudomonas sp.]|nr:major facilitator transporter [Pseudomonas sp.]